MYLSPNSINGVKGMVDLSFFTREEISIIELLSRRDWYVTRAERIEEMKEGDMCLKAVLVKPQESVKEAFNLQREVIVIFSPYSRLDMRSISSFDNVNIPRDRAEEICGILISKDSSVQQQVDNFLRNQKEPRIIIPFTYDELLAPHSKPEEMIKKRIRERFYSRDLFGFQEALTEDRYFFGRRDLIFELLNQHLSGSCSGIFGLRKTGKTSILYGVKRALDRKKSTAVYIDCMILHLQSWNSALYEVMRNVVVSCGVKQSTIHTKEDYMDVSAVTSLFAEDIEKVYLANQKKSILIIFDEIENISFGTSPSESWQNGDAFIKFWQSLRSIFQLYAPRRIFTYLIAGTNPRCVEQPTINKTDNPIFSQFPPHYIAPFSFEKAKEMIGKLGGYMGLSFDDETIKQIVADFGGHPLLIRQQCSYVHKKVAMERRPITISMEEYLKYKDSFYRESGGFIQYAKMILGVLENWYKDEYEMLKYLANGQTRDFEYFANESPDMIAHLLNYGIIDRTNDGTYYFKIDVLKQYLRSRREIAPVSSGQMSNCTRVFISYSHKDKQWLDLIQEHLSGLCNINSDIDYWSDQRIEVGSNWRDEITEAVNNADVAILLVSRSYLASKFIASKEWPLILHNARKGKLQKIIPIVVAPCTYSQSLLSEFQSANDPENTLAEMTSAAADRLLVKIMGIIESICTSM